MVLNLPFRQELYKQKETGVRIQESEDGVRLPNLFLAAGMTILFENTIILLSSGS